MPRPSGLPRSKRLLSIACACALAFALVACPGGGRPSPKPTNSASPARAPGTRGGEIVVAYPSEPSTLNPYLPGGDSPATRDLVRLLMPSLWRIGPDGKRERSLLTDEPVTAQTGGQFLAGIHLREDAKWSDGTPITTADLRFTWSTLRNRRLPIVPRLAYEKISDVRIASARSATLVFPTPYAGWQDLFSAGAGLLPEHLLRNAPFNTALNGGWPASGGPFVLKTWTRGLEMIFQRNPNAWGDEPYLDRIRVQFVPDVDTALRLLRAGRVHVLGPYAAVDLARRGGLVPGASVTSDFGSTWTALMLNVRTPVLTDARVRHALAYSIDRPALVEGLVRAEGKLLDGFAAGTEIPDGTEAATFRSDVREASRLLGAAGWRGSGTRTKGGRELTFTVAAPPGELTDRVLRAMHAQARRTGFDLNAVTLDDDRLWRDWIRGSRFQAAMVVVRDAPGGNLLERYATGSPHNVCKLADRTLDGLLDAAIGHIPLDPASLAGASRRLAQLLPLIPLYRSRVTTIAARAVRNIRANGSADGFLWNAADWSLA